MKVCIKKHNLNGICYRILQGMSHCYVRLPQHDSPKEQLKNKQLMKTEKSLPKRWKEKICPNTTYQVVAPDLFLWLGK